MKKTILASEVVCRSLEELGVEVVFGIPGTQTLSVYEAIRRSPLRPVLSVSETAAAFEACGYYATTGKIPLLCVTPGPGLQMALPAISEAREDSLAMLVLTTTLPEELTSVNGHIILGVEQFTASATKERIRIDTANSLRSGIRQAYLLASGDEPGPVIVEVAESVLREEVNWFPDGSVGVSHPPLDPQAVADVAERFKSAKRPLLICGRGCAKASALVNTLASSLKIPVITTTSGRGTIPETHPFACCVEYCANAINLINELISETDLVLAVGNKFSKNSSGEYALDTVAERLIHVNCDTNYFSAHHHGALVINADAREFLAALLPEIADLNASLWSADEIAAIRDEFLSYRAKYVLDVLSIIPEGYADWSDFFNNMRQALKEDAIVVTDSGAHQYIARNHWTVLKPETFIVPVGFQSMGFGIPAAVGAKLGNPEKPVVVITGDGGFQMVGMETLTSIREKLPISIIVFRDDALGLIRHQQWRDYGWESSATLLNPDLSVLAKSFGIEYVNLSAQPDQLARALNETPQVTRLLELRVRPSSVARRRRLKSRTKSVVRRTMGKKFFGLLKRALARK